MTQVMEEYFVATAGKPPEGRAGLGVHISVFPPCHLPDITALLRSGREKSEAAFAFFGPLREISGL